MNTINNIHAPPSTVSLLKFINRTSEFLVVRDFHFDLPPPPPLLPPPPPPPPLPKRRVFAAGQGGQVREGFFLQPDFPGFRYCRRLVNVDDIMKPDCSR
jgi:hypothetical protein